MQYLYLVLASGTNAQVAATNPAAIAPSAARYPSAADEKRKEEKRRRDAEFEAELRDEL